MHRGQQARTPILDEDTKCEDRHGNQCTHLFVCRKYNPHSIFIDCIAPDGAGPVWSDGPYRWLGTTFTDLHKITCQPTFVALQLYITTRSADVSDTRWRAHAPAPWPTAAGSGTSSVMFAVAAGAWPQSPRAPLQSGAPTVTRTAPHVARPRSQDAEANEKSRKGGG